MGESNKFFIMKDVLKSIFNEKNMPDLNIHRLKSKWVNIVGDNLSLHTYPSRIQGSILFINCDHQGWINTLQFYKEEIQEKIKILFNDEIIINDIKFVYNIKKRQQ